MGTNDKSYVEKPFRIENCILKGKVMPYEPPYKSLGKLFFDSLKKNSSFVQQIDSTTGDADTCGEMLDRSIKCALWMEKQGVKKGDIITISSHSHRDDIVCYLAILFLGAVCSPWHCGMDIKMARHFMKLTQPKMVFANEGSVAVVLEAAKLEGHQPKVVTFGKHADTTPYCEVLSGHSESSVTDFQCTEIENSEEIAAIIFSSGTTGLPKGVEVSHRSILSYAELDGDVSYKGHTMMWFSTLFWISGTMMNTWCIAQKVRRVIAPTYNSEFTCKSIQKYKVTWIGMSVSIANRLARYNRLQDYDLSSLKMISTGGSFIGKEAEDLLRKRFPHAKVVQSYGMTELGNVVTLQVADSESGSCGRPCPNCEIKIVDLDTGNSLGPHQKGELCAKSKSIMSGYYKNPEATKDLIDKDGWVHSGDIAYYNEKGDIFIIDRLKDIIKFRTHQVVPSEIEEVLHLHPAVLEAAVVSIPDPVDGEQPIAFVTKIPDKEVSEEELIKFVTDNLPNELCGQLCGGVKFLSSLPHTPSGKVSRRELKEMAKSIAVR